MVAQGGSLSAKRTTRPAKSSRRLAATRRHRRVARQHGGWHMTSVTRPLARRSWSATEVGAYPTGNIQYICTSGRAAAPQLSLCSTRQQSQCTCALERDAQFDYAASISSRIPPNESRFDSRTSSRRCCRASRRRASHHPAISIDRERFSAGFSGLIHRGRRSRWRNSHPRR